MTHGTVAGMERSRNPVIGGATKETGRRSGRGTLAKFLKDHGASAETDLL